MKVRLAAACAAVCMAASVQAADPTAVIASPGISFAEYSSPTFVGQGQVDDDVLYFVDELTGVLGKAWYIFFDPLGPDAVSATLTFDSAITGVFFTKATLDGSNATYGNPAINYGTSTLIGLESADTFSFVPGSNVLTIDWCAIDPGDHIRVFTTPIPEPETYVLLTAGLLAVGFIGRRRSRA